MIKIDEGMMGGDWNPDVDSLAVFAEELASVTGQQVTLSTWGDASEISEYDWNLALDNYSKRIADHG